MEDSDVDDNAQWHPGRPGGGVPGVRVTCCSPSGQLEPVDIGQVGRG